ncbi:hypothetical protein [Rufibacter immobilis]|uniref:hypothetical protein n=1 Tax=Rufibacter immobilis TaxID=1348778 RepID=UPI0035E7C51A
MEFKVIRIHEGDGQHPNTEYVFLQALTDENLKNLSFHLHSPHDAYIDFPSLPDVEVKKGDFVILYTGFGRYLRATINTGEPLHKVYLEQPTCLWTNLGLSPQQLCLSALEGVLV